MNLENDKKKSEERALDALMAAAFCACGSDEPLTEEEAEKLAAHPPRLSDEDEAAIASLGPDLVERLLEQSKTKTHKYTEEQTIIEKEIEEAYIAMNRQLGDKDLSDETRREIERKRRELLGEEDVKRGECGGT
jgi:hypothetical protein